MDIEAAERRDLEDVGWQDPTIRGRDDHIRGQCAQLGGEFSGADFGRLEDRDATLEGGLFNRRSCQDLMTAGWLVRLADNSQEGVAILEQAKQRRDGKIGSPHEDDAWFYAVH